MLFKSVDAGDRPFSCEVDRIKINKNQNKQKTNSASTHRVFCATLHISSCQLTKSTVTVLLPIMVRVVTWQLMGGRLGGWAPSLAWNCLRVGGWALLLAWNYLRAKTGPRHYVRGGAQRHLSACMGTVYDNNKHVKNTRCEIGQIMRI